MNIQKGKCVCDNATMKLNPDGVCSLCEVAGCESCAVNDSSTCVQCTDCSAVLKEGSCECPMGYVLDEYYYMDENGSCILQFPCSVYGC